MVGNDVRIEEYLGRDRGRRRGLLVWLVVDECADFHGG